MKNKNKRLLVYALDRMRDHMIGVAVGLIFLGIVTGILRALGIMP